MPCCACASPQHFVHRRSIHLRQGAEFEAVAVTPRHGRRPLPLRQFIHRTQKMQLIEKYADSGRLQDAQRLFDNAFELQGEPEAWNILIAAYARLGHLQPSIGLFQRMNCERMDVPPELAAKAIAACTQQGTLEDCREIYAGVMNSGLELDKQVSCELIRMYTKFSGIEDQPRAMFRRFCIVSLLGWTAMLSALIKHKPDEALIFFQEMDLNGVKPDGVTYAAILGLCKDTGNLEEGRKIHGRIVQEGLIAHPSVANHLVRLYIDTGCLDEAVRVFQQFSYRQDIILWSSMAAGYVKHNCMKQALELLQLMDLEGVKPGDITYTTLLVACGNNLSTGKIIHQRLVAAPGFGRDWRTATALINMYGKHGKVEEARSIFQQSVVKNGQVWSSLIGAYAETDDAQEAFRLFYRMQLEGHRAEVAALIKLLNACAKAKALCVGKMLHRCLRESNYVGVPEVDHSLVNMYGKCGSLKDAKAVFAKIQVKNVISWSCLIDSCIHCSTCCREARIVYRKMLQEGVRPTEVPILMLLTACGNFRDLNFGQEIEQHIANSELENSTAVQGSLIFMYDSCGKLRKARSIFRRMPDKDMSAWMKMVRACAYARKGHMALRLFQRMQLDGLEPDSIIFTHMLSACLRAGLTKAGFQIFTSILQDYWKRPSVEHYGCLMQLLATEKRLNEAELLAECLPAELATVAVWEILFRACVDQGDVKRAVRAVEHILELDPSKSSEACNIFVE